MDCMLISHMDTAVPSAQVNWQIVAHANFSTVVCYNGRVQHVQQVFVSRTRLVVLRNKGCVWHVQQLFVWRSRFCGKLDCQSWKFEVGTYVGKIE